MSKTINHIIESIDSLPIYSKDYGIIKDILSHSDPKLFASIVEGIIDGDIYWLDFEKILANTGYSTMVEKTLESQEKLSDEYSKLMALRSTLYGEDVEYSLKNLALGKSVDNTDEESLMYQHELDNARENILYELTKISEEDTDLSILCRIKLFNYLMNYEDELAPEDQKINPEEIFLFINDYLVPIDYRYQVLDSTDFSFMKENGLTEDEMKKYKAMAFFLRRSSYSKGV